MNTQLTKINTTNILGKEINTYRGWEEELWIPAIELARGLGYSDPSRAVSEMISRHSQEFEDCNLTSQIANSGQKRNMTFLNESGLYLFIMKSKTEKGAEFRKMIIQMLKEIRKGQYIPIKQVEDRIAIQVKSYQDKIIQMQDKEIKRLETKNIKKPQAPAITEEEKQAMVEWTKIGKTPREIAKKLGRSASAVRYHIKGIA